MENVQLSEPQKELIRDTWQIVNQDQIHHGTVLFTRLFELEPELVFLFQYNSANFSSVQECLNSSEFTEHIRKVSDSRTVSLAELSCLSNLHIPEICPCHPIHPGNRWWSIPSIS
ncbi:hypothetical protein GDO78_010780 [Eleutherodactylus coqui]|uniref:Nitrite reductase n=1 Tax=Eleutherodactylus coqui TaxID=57060 RepID=A0A8J6F620_ELECQ|nr:hypothetical protein GDO78_010780 [Eleutherodactylus coqui]